MEEMFVILDNEGQFTIDGRTSSLTGSAGVPCRMGRSHGPHQWLSVLLMPTRAAHHPGRL
jgi:hypothetical protein